MPQLVREKWGEETGFSQGRSRASLRLCKVQGSHLLHLLGSLAFLSFAAESTFQEVTGVGFFVGGTGHLGCLPECTSCAEARDRPPRACPAPPTRQLLIPATAPRQAHLQRLAQLQVEGDHAYALQPGREARPGHRWSPCPGALRAEMVASPARPGAGQSIHGGGGSGPQRVAGGTARRRCRGNGPEAVARGHVWI